MHKLCKTIVNCMWRKHCLRNTGWSNCYILVIFVSAFSENLTQGTYYWKKKWKGKLLSCLMFIGPCIIAIVDEWKTNVMSLAILFHLLCAQHVSDINISIFRSLRLCWWITTSVVLFSVRFVLEIFCCGWYLVVFVLQAEAQLCFSLQNEHHSKPAAPNLQHTTNWEQDDRCGNSSTKSQAPEDGYINVRNMLST